MTKQYSQQALIKALENEIKRKAEKIMKKKEKIKAKKAEQEQKEREEQIILTRRQAPERHAPPTPETTTSKLI